MKVQVNTDHNIEGSEALTEHVTSEVESTLDRFRERITRIEVHLSDESSSAKHRENDKRCVVEARLNGMQPISVSDDASAVELALTGALEKMERTLTRTLEKLDDHHHR